MKYLTLMIIPFPGAAVRSFRIRHRTLKLISVAAVLLFCGVVGSLIYLRPILNKAKDYDRLQAENQLLALEKQKINDLTDKMESIDQLVAKIQLAQGVKKFEETNKEEPGEQSGEEGLSLETLPLGESRTALMGSAEMSETTDSKVPYGLPMAEKSYISRMFNPDIYHFGIDIALKQGTPVKATGDGAVTIADKNEDLGFYVMIKHANGFSTLYAHNSRLAVNSGDRVKKGDVIAYSGNMGLSSGPHLHYAIFDQNGNPIDPLPYLQP